MSIRIERHLTDDDLATALCADVAAGLTATPRSLPPKYFYDEAGSALFEQITELPEYYPTRREREILRARGADIAAATGADTLVELGSGSSEKTRLLLDALATGGTLRAYIPVDVSDTAVLPAATAIAADYPGLAVHAVVADFERHLELLPTGGRRLVVFLGGTIGNFPPAERARFLAALRRGLEPGDALLLGTDLLKDAGRLVSAYDDAAGVTAAFNRNVLAVVNRELKADFDLDAFSHVAVWDTEQEWVEMRLESRRDQQVNVAALDLGVRFAPGEQLRTEVSAKFRREGLAQEYAEAGFALRQWWTDPAGDFALSLATPA